jgi:TRAP-type C4-dicarboxylate transport system permease small subunit
MKFISDLIDRLSRVLLVVILSAMALAVFAQVIFRYVIPLPLFWTEEFARYCLVWSSFLGAGVALKRSQHIAVTFFVERFLTEGKRMVAALLAELLVLVLLAVVLLGGVHLVGLTRHQLSPALQIPMAIPYLAVPIGAGIMIIHVLTAGYERLLRTVRTLRSGNGEGG